MWSDASEGVKYTWKAKAAEAKEQHSQQNPGYSYQPRKPLEKKRRMTKRKMAQMSTAVAVENNDQQVQTSQQQPLPNVLSMDFSILCDTSMAAIDNLGHIIDQHNNSGQLLVDYANNPCIEVRSDEVHDAENNIIPQHEIDLLVEILGNGETALLPGLWWNGMDNDGNMMDVAQINNQQFLNSAASKDLEQERQEDLFDECFDWNMFGNSFESFGT